MSVENYYEFLQISPNAEIDTIRRVYRFLAGRFHPDNPETGDAVKFHMLKQAYDTLSDPEKRSAYDAQYKAEAPQPKPMSESVDFMGSLDGELNRRLALLALLYIQRRNSPYRPEVALNDVESRMGFPRDYLQFTTWYLRNKGYITQADNSDFTLTAAGVDFVEENSSSIPLLSKLLTEGTVPPSPENIAANRVLTPSPTPVIVPPSPPIVTRSSDRPNGGEKK